MVQIVYQFVLRDAIMDVVLLRTNVNVNLDLEELHAQNVRTFFYIIASYKWLKLYELNFHFLDIILHMMENFNINMVGTNVFCTQKSGSLFLR
jgi:hypothetical protein